MLPSAEEYRKHIQIFDRKYPGSSFDEFWSYREEVGREGSSILDASHLDETIRLLNQRLLKHRGFRLARTVVASKEQIRTILESIRPEYKIIRSVALGKGQIATDRKLHRLA